MSGGKLERLLPLAGVLAPWTVVVAILVYRRQGVTAAPAPAV